MKRIATNLPIAIFLLARLTLVASFSVESLRGYGDFVHFYQLAQMGWPFADFWVEFPPIFPFLSALIYRLAGGQQHVYDTVLMLVLTFAQAGSLVIFTQIAGRLYDKGQAERRAWMYMGSIVALFYGWGYFDPLAVCCMLLGLLWILQGRDLQAGLALAVGTLVKWFPLLALAVAWRYRPVRKAMLATAITLGLTALVYAGLYLAYPQNTLASIRAQSSKGSWETPWALIDGNFGTGNFGPEVERLDPSLALKSIGNPPRIPPLLSLLPFALFGGWLYVQAKGTDDRAKISFFGLTLSIFFLWLPGWSPQWVLYLLPVILLTMPMKEAILLLSDLILVNLSEWPVMLSRGLSWSLWITIPVRVGLLILLIYRLYIQTRVANKPMLEEI